MRETTPPNEQTTLLLHHEGNHVEGNKHNEKPSSSSTLYNFYFMAALFSAGHGCTVSCLSLATARLGSVGALQSGMLYLSYTLSAVLGATYIIQRFGARNAMATGMLLFCTYVACFWVATVFPAHQDASALTGAAIGGLGAGLLWNAQGTYLAQAAQRYSLETGMDLSTCTSNLAGGFAFIYLLVEVCLRSMSTALTMSWGSIFAIYTVIALTSSGGMFFVKDYGTEEEDSSSATSTEPTTALYKVTAAVRLLLSDRKMKHMVGMNFIFGFASAFLNSYINAEVVRVALHDDDSSYIGALSSWIALSAALSSLLLRSVRNKGIVLVGGAVCFFMVAFPFIVQPDATKWGLSGILTIYTLHGVGRSTFESTLKAIVCDFFPQNTAGAFGNIIMLNGLSNAIGYFLSFRLQCGEPSAYCVEYSDKTMHSVLSFELLVCVTAVAAVVGYWRAEALDKREKEAKAELMLLIV